jgi:uncharacterized caspase-like protein
MKQARSLLAVLLLLALAHGRASAQGGAGLRRFALAVSANDGGPGRGHLQYAERDAAALSAVLQQLGGVEPADALRLLQPNVHALTAAFAELRTRAAEAQRAGARTELVFYYSGHSDENALLLAGERISYARVRQLLDELPMTVRIAILDSCASGAFTRLKGGARRAPFLVDTSTQVSGHAFLTSSSADEAAQESDRIGGSFFTHFLVSGLRGAADASGDRKITLTEAYRFAFEETLARTSQTQYGSQHPAYEIRLAGTGDLVMTDLRATTAEIALDPSVEGRLFVWDTRRSLLVEVYKHKGKQLVLALPPGRYKLELSREGRFFAAQASATAGAPQTLRESAFTEVAREGTMARGVVERYELRPFAAALIPPFSTNHQKRTRPVMNHLNVSALYDDPDALEGFQLGLFGAGARDYAKGMQLSLMFADTTELSGLQLSGLVNVTRSFGFGAQLTFGVNFLGAVALGNQSALALNYADALVGTQFAFGVNIARDGARGLQAAGVNWAGEIDGTQLGFVNLARHVQGLQLGLLNVATERVRGLQLGLINYADEADVSIAVIGVTRKGGAHAQIAITDVAAPELSLRLDATYNYTFVSMAIAPYRGSVHHAYLIGAGVGAKVPVYRRYAWLDVDLGVHVVQPIDDWYRGVPNTLWQLRILARGELHAHFSVFAGLTVNVLLQLDKQRAVTPGLPIEHHVVLDSEDERISYWPGFAAGVRF